MGQGLSCQLHVSSEHPQGSVGRHRVEAHVHQLGENRGGGVTAAAAHRPRLHCADPRAALVFTPGQGGQPYREYVSAPGVHMAAASCHTTIATTGARRRRGRTEEGGARCARARSSQKGTGLWADRTC